MFTGVLKNALPAWFVPPFVNCSRVSSRSVLPLNVIDDPAVANPFVKLIPVPPRVIVYVALATGLFDNPLAVAIALTVVVPLMLKAPEYNFVVPDPGLGVLPSVV